MMPNFANVLSAVRDRTMNPSNPSTPGGNGLITAPSTQEIQRLLPQATVRTEDAMETAHLSLLEQMYRTQAQAQSNLNYSISATAVDPHAVSDYSYWYYLPNSPSYGGIQRSPSMQPAHSTVMDWPETTGLPAEEPPTPVEAPERTMLKRVPVEVEAIDLNDPRKKLATEAEMLLGYMPLAKELHTPGMLKCALAKLEITILEEKSVFAYKKQMAEHYRTTDKLEDPTWRVTSLKEYTEQVPEFVLQKAVEIKRELPEAMFYVEQLAQDPFLIVTLEPLTDFVSHERTLERELDPETAAYVEVWSEPKFEAMM
jgi:hypothetical protein